MIKGFLFFQYFLKNDFGRGQQNFDVKMKLSEEIVNCRKVPVMQPILGEISVYEPKIRHHHDVCLKVFQNKYFHEKLH